MKTNTFLTFLLLPLIGFSQNQKPTSPVGRPTLPAGKSTSPVGKGVSPIANAERPTAQNTYAVVIGISDYREPLIPDLRYADRDAKAFADWLRAPQGLGLPDSSIRLLTNQMATTAQMIVNLDWLIESSKAGDRVFIYFSGHGDVERVTKFNLGYLLSHDSPPAVYGAGAFSLQYLQAILSTLAENNVQVFMITDACRAGKLAGSGINGTQVTAQQLLQQFANEIKILSCQPDEFSLEGEQWGGGRGCFSYHLEDALYGFADSNNDQSVDLLELRRYMEDRVRTEAEPLSQVPSVSGPLKTSVVEVRSGEVAARRAGKGNQKTPFLAINNKGMESQLIEKMDTSVQELFAQFNMAIDSGRLLSPSGKSANDYFITLMEKPEMTALRGTMKRRLAAALMEEGQTVINKILQTDPSVLDNIWANRVNYDHVPAYLERAAEILGERHYIWRDLKAKEFYFRAMTIRKENYPDSSNVWRLSEHRRLLEQSLAWDSTSAVVYYEMGQTSNFGSKQELFFYEKAAELSPKWALVYSSLGGCTEGNLSVNYYKKAMSLDSNFLPPFNWIAWRYEFFGQVDSADYWRNIYVNKFRQKFETDAVSITAFECNAVGNALWRLKRYEEAKVFLLTGESISAGKHSGIYQNLVPVYTELLEFEKAVNACINIQRLSNESFWSGTLGDLYFYFLNDSSAAITAWAKAQYFAGINQILAWGRMGNFSKAYLLAKENVKFDGQYKFYIAEFAQKMGMKDTARHYFNLIVNSEDLEFKRNEFSFPNYVFKALSQNRLGRIEEFNELLDTARIRLDGDPWLYFYLATIHAQTNEENTAIESLHKAIELGWKPNPLMWLHGTLCDPFLDPIRETDAFKALVRKHFPKYYDITTRIPGKK